MSNSPCEMTRQYDCAKITLVGGNLGANKAFGGLMITPQPSSRTRPPRILIVEDERDIAHMIEELVREFGYEVSSVARTAAMARLQIAMRNFDCVLLDINLKGESHPEISDVLLEAGVPFAFVTGYDYVLEFVMREYHC